jgi:SepF-like predicted cell division protein (DUF552 family)
LEVAVVVVEEEVVVVATTDIEDDRRSIDTTRRRRSQRRDASIKIEKFDDNEVIVFPFVVSNGFLSLIFALNRF